MNLPLGSIRSKELFSSHWLQHRLRLEPEWNALRATAQTALERLSELWTVQRSRVSQYGAEQPLEEVSALTDRLFDVSDIVALLEAAESKKAA